jgi:hypothetical protein
MLSASGGNALNDYAGTTPVMKFDEFFDGPLKGWGIVQNRSGKVIKSFTIDMVGSWKSDKGSLQEHFVYSDGKIQDRTWDIRKESENKFVATADGIKGEAPGESKGQAIRWNYVMAIEVDGTSYNVSFDDWMFLMTDDLIINRSTLTKFGFKVAEVTISIQKPPRQ